MSARFVPRAITVEVGDRGPGIAPENAERVFEKFYRAQEGGGGIGLGLTISRGIVMAHGGRLWVEPRDGGGAAFRFTLPIDGEAPELEPAEGEPKPELERPSAVELDAGKASEP